MSINIDLLYRQFDDVMNSRDEFVEHIRTHKDPTVRTFTSEKTSEGIVRRALVNYLDNETNLTNLQKAMVEIYLIEQHSFDLRANYRQHVKVSVMPPMPAMEDE